MAQGEIAAAMDRLQERKLAAAGVGPGRPVAVVKDETSRLIWSGLDLDWDEALEQSPVFARAFLRAVAAGIPAEVAAVTICFDGIAIGLLIAEARQREQAGGS